MEGGATLLEWFGMRARALEMKLREWRDRFFFREELEYAQQLARGLAERHYPGAPEFKPFDDVWGVLSQIDNMSCGLVRDPDPEGWQRYRRERALREMREPADEREGKLA